MYLSAGDRKTLWVGVSIIGAIVLLGRGIPAWYRWQRDIRQEAVESAAEAMRSQYAVRNRPAIVRLLRTGEQRYDALGDVFVDGESATAAATALMSAVSDVAGESGMQMGALQPVIDSAELARQRVSVRGSAGADVRGIAHFLAAIESGMPFMAVREFTVTQPDVMAPGDRAESLRFDFVIEALAPSDALGGNRSVGPAQDDGQMMATVPPITAYDPRGLERASDSVLVNDPFRMERKPSRVAFGAPPLPPPTVAPQVPRIRPTLGGIVGGPPWKAVLSNIPGREGGVIVATGDTVAGMTIRLVRQDMVIVKGADTTWTLTTRQ